MPLRLPKNFGPPSVRAGLRAEESRIAPALEAAEPRYAQYERFIAGRYPDRRSLCAYHERSTAFVARDMPEPRLWLVFPNGEGNVEFLINFHRRRLGRVQCAAGITTDPRHPKYGLHSLRHAAASLFIEQGFSPKRVQALIGHSTITMTFDTYGHLFPAADDDQAAMSQLQARLLVA